MSDERAVDDFVEMLHPDTRGASLAVCAHGKGVGATAHIALVRVTPETLERVEVRTWTVRYASGALRPSWGFTSEAAADDRRRGRVHGGLASYETALGAALADALSDLTIVVTEIDRHGIEEDAPDGP